MAHLPNPSEGRPVRVVGGLCACVAHGVKAVLDRWGPAG
jgi:hypothetical protein